MIMASCPRRSTRVKANSTDLYVKTWDVKGKIFVVILGNELVEPIMEKINRDGPYVPSKSVICLITRPHLMAHLKLLLRLLGKGNKL